ncbi:MAG: N-formylglutamate amidohydrolase [Alphaproteobacteria bacterium]|nr:MAG: N-formylglutamate amidohydrolase [Alphaproteobacteria bacterium]
MIEMSRRTVEAVPPSTAEMHFPTSHRLLDPGDPHPVEIVNEHGAGGVLLTCEHAGRAVPRRLGDLGVAPADWERHIAWDIGAADLARLLSRTLDAPLVLQRYSRLVIDCNRPLDAPDCIPEISDGTSIPANRGLSLEARAQRYAEIHMPLHQAIDGMLNRPGPAALVSVHSFTPVFAGQARPMQAALLFNRDARLAHALHRELASRRPDLPIALNAPYSVDDISDFTIPRHGEARGIPHVLLELRNDQLAKAADREAWADLLAGCITASVRHLAEAA